MATDLQTPRQSFENSSVNSPETPAILNRQQTSGNYDGVDARERLVNVLHSDVSTPDKARARAYLTRLVSLHFSIVSNRA